MPTSQELHTADPAAAAYFPATHAAHATLPSLAHPASHRVHVWLVVEYPYPALHALHTPVSTTHVLQPTPPGDATSPHGVHAPAPAKAYVLAAHAWHVRSPTVEKVPAAHCDTVLVDPEEEHA